METCVHGGLHNLQGPVQNGNAKLLVQKLLRIPWQWQQSIKTSVWPFWAEAPHDCIGCKSMKPDLLVSLSSVYYAWKWKDTFNTLWKVVQKYKFLFVLAPKVLNFSYLGNPLMYIKRYQTELKFPPATSVTSSGFTLKHRVFFFSPFFAKCFCLVNNLFVF